MKYKIEYKKKKDKFGFIGMNEFASESHNIKWKHKNPEHIIEIYDKVPKKVRLDTIHHEEYERYRMDELERKGISPKKAYHISHEEALRFEKLNRPFPQKNIKRKLKEMRFKIL